MRQLGTRIKKVKFGTKGEAILLELVGYINASTFIEYEKTLKGLIAKKIKNLAIDFKEVDYINSSGMGFLLSVHDALRNAGGALVLIHVSPQVGQTMQMLGINQVVPFLKGKSEMADFFTAKAPAIQTFTTSKLKQPTVVASPSQAFAARAAAQRPQTPVCPVMVLSPSTNLFTDLIKLRFGKNSEHFHVLNDCTVAWNRIGQIAPDLIILEDSLPGSDEFLGKVKTDRDRGHASVIKVYAKSTDPRTKVAFKIWENDYLKEPFELKELFALAEAELVRVARDRTHAMQQVHYSFQYSEENLNRALTIGKNAIFAAHLSEDKAVPLYAAFQEATDNALRHGNRYDQRKRVDITLLVSPDEIRIAVEDEGKGFDFTKYLKLASELDAVARTRLAREEGKIGGLGIKLMMECADKVEYFEKGKRIQLTKKLGAPVAAPKVKTANV